MLMTRDSHRIIYLFISKKTSHFTFNHNGACMVKFLLNSIVNIQPSFFSLFFFFVLSLENSQRALGQSDPGTSVKRGLHQTSKNCSSEGCWISTYTTRAWCLAFQVLSRAGNGGKSWGLPSQLLS